MQVRPADVSLKYILRAHARASQDVSNTGTKTLNHDYVIWRMRSVEFSSECTYVANSNQPKSYSGSRIFIWNTAHHATQRITPPHGLTATFTSCPMTAHYLG